PAFGVRRKGRRDGVEARVEGHAAGVSRTSNQPKKVRRPVTEREIVNMELVDLIGIVPLPFGIYLPGKAQTSARHFVSHPRHLRNDSICRHGIYMGLQCSTGRAL